MQHLILGYGYCGYYLAQELLAQGKKVTAISRHLDQAWSLPGMIHQAYDLQQPLQWDEESIVYYLIAPPAAGQHDSFLKQFLQQSTIKAKKIIYFGSSGVYGNHQGNWVTEESPCHIANDRQLRRRDAEQQWLAYGQQHGIATVLLRVAGIFGPDRLPVKAAQAQTPILEPQQAPCMNHIYVRDLVRIAYLLSQTTTKHSVFNVADGHPEPMGSLQQRVAALLQLAPAPCQSWADIWTNASPMKREFMQGSKRLCITRLEHVLQGHLSITNLADAVKNSLPKSV